MKKKATPAVPESTWGIDADTQSARTTETDLDAVTQVMKTKKLDRVDILEAEPLYDLEGLMTDFPTAKELEKFVFDQTGYVLNLKGRSNKFKYSTAMDVLNGAAPDEYLLGTENPYLDKNDLIPIDTIKTVPPIPMDVDGAAVVTRFDSRAFPHPDPDWKASGQKCDVVFKKYTNNVITYEVIGPISTRPVGTRINKFGKEVPEKYEWVDPRTGEQVIRNANGMFTPLGTRLRGFMQRMKVNKSNQWDVWIDRDFIIDSGGGNNSDPWSNI
jgi:hypothetical protein